MLFQRSGILRVFGELQKAGDEQRGLNGVSCTMHKLIATMRYFVVRDDCIRHFLLTMLEVTRLARETVFCIDMTQFMLHDRDCIISINRQLDPMLLKGF